MLLKKYISLLLVISISVIAFAQEPEKDVNKLSREQVLEMTIEELSYYELDEVMKLMEIVGASSLEELYEMLLNKDVTSASKSEESLFDSPLSSTVLSHDEIIASGATSIEEVLRLVPGIIVREKTNGNYDVHIRGNDNLPAKNMLLYSENSNTLVMINGRPVFNYTHGGTLWETLPVSFEDIDRIEVVRGPSSALYGPNAVSGVINIITQKVTKETPLISGNMQGGSLNSYIGDIAFRKQLNDKISVGITGNYEIRDREKEELYVYNGQTSDGANKYMLNGERVGDGWYTKEEMRKLTLIPELGGFGIWPDDNPNDIYNIDDVFPNPKQSRQRTGANGYIDFTPADDINIAISGGYQNSEVLSSTMGDMPTPFAHKSSTSGYADIQGNIKDLSIQANYNGGNTNFMHGNEGFELDMEQISAQAEYNLKLNKLAIRPGISFQSISYDDTKYISELGRGYLNQKRTSNISAGSIRLDYKPIEKLRLVAALRAEKYDSNEDMYPSWQFVGSYKINENNIIRAVYSRANQSSFLINSYSNFLWKITNRPYPRVIYFGGNDDYNLKTMDMVELGYRVRPSKNLLIDFEAFYNNTENFGALMPDYTDVNILNPLQVLTANPQGSVAPIVIPDSVHIKYTSFEMKSKQIGASINIDWVISEKLIANGHFTFQETILDNYLPYSRDDLIAFQAEDAAITKLTTLGGQLVQGTLDPATIAAGVKASSTNTPINTKNNYKHKATPDYYGGFSLTYRPFEKLEIYPQAYFYGEQLFENQYNDVTIKAKFLFNTKVSYKATNKLTVYVNGKNLLNQTSSEFAFMDEIPTMVFGGLNFKF
jgi:iron complex outermembrane receptor protein